MSIASDIIHGHIPDFDYYVQEGESLDDIDEYGFTPLIETVITRQKAIAEHLIERKVDINKPDVTGRTALHWAVDNNDIDFARYLLEQGADVNAYTTAGLSTLVYPVLRGQDVMKQLLYQYGAKLDFALDFIYAKLLGHRFELQGDVDIVNPKGEFIELDYEGFILEFTVAIIKDSLRRFTSSYSAKHLRAYFPFLYTVMDAFTIADELLQLQHHVVLNERHQAQIKHCLKSPMIILPAASRGHALGFVHYKHWWAKVDRGENSLKEGTVNFYHISKNKVFDAEFIQDFLYKKQNRRYFHHVINQRLGLMPFAQLPISAQITGNCSWANIQALVPVAYVMQQLPETGILPTEIPDELGQEAMFVYNEWLQWDQDRALDECIQRFYIANPVRKASYASMLAAVLFQACDASIPHHLERAEKILTLLTLPDYYYILESYLETYCVKRLTRRGNNLLKLLDDCGFNPNIGVNPIATGLKKE
jgi:hypothetical protein